MKAIQLIVITAAIAFASACKDATVPVAIIPEPDSISIGEDCFKVAGAPSIVGDNIPASAVEAIKDFSNHLQTVTGKPIRKNAPAFSYKLDEKLAPEAYTIEINRKGANISASDLNGFLYAIQSVKQMLPTAVYGNTASKEKWILPAVRIQDGPRFAYRGLMLDSSRHFIPAEEVYKIIDLMLVHKMNRLHWHLTDDQGWRIESKKYPRLTEIGAWRNGTEIQRRKVADGIRYGGFYTQDQLRAIVKYAAARGITIVPEIDIPGHTTAAVASYPELGCSGKQVEVRQLWGISEDVLCPGKESTFEFLEGILTELMDIFPSEYIHIGGDECPKQSWENCPRCQARIRQLGLRDKDGFSAEHYLQNYVTARVQKIINDHGRKIIGWDEILEGELAEGATVMSWRGTKGGIEAIGKGFDVIMSPNNYCYINYFQTKERDKEPRRNGRYLPIEKVYGYEPSEGIPEDGMGYVLGVQCNLWGEFLPDTTHLEYQLLPRMSAFSEVAWCRKDNKDYGRFLTSLEHMTGIYKALDFVYCRYLWGYVGLPGHELPARSKEELDTLNYHKVPYMEY